MAIHRLTDLQVKRLKKPGRYVDGGGLSLRIRERLLGPTMRWNMRYKRPGQKWPTDIDLGRYPDVSLARARDKALAIRALLADGKDPTQERAERLAQVVQFTSFAQAAQRFLVDKPKTDVAWPQLLRDYINPVLGELPVGSIVTAHVAEVLRPIWQSKYTTAQRVRGKIEMVLDWAKGMGLRTGENPARWRGNLDAIFDGAKGKVEGHAALPYVEAPSFMAKLRAQDGIKARALEMLVLTATRAGETRGLDWCEIDRAARVWTIPGARTKTGKALRVPLSARCIEILEGLGPKPKGLVFAGGRGKQMTNDQLRDVLHELAGTEITMHGLRSTFRDWAAERAPSFAHEVCEMALGHVVGNKVSLAYKRTDHLEQRARLMQQWCDFCAGPPAVEGEKVVSLRRSA